MKRAFDLLVSGLFLLLFWPVLLVLALLIRRQDSHSAIFAQQRIGQDAAPFTCYKFRTMQADTKHLPSHMVDASVITPLGRRLRQLKLDELPQLYNVLRGDMSLVGPRPCLTTQAELIDARRRRGVFAVPPGITGLAQVRGVDMSDPERLAELDAEYARSRSFVYDLKLIFATLGGKGMGVDRVR